MRAAPKDGYCHQCRPLCVPSARKKYFWTEEMDRLIRGVYTAGYGTRERGRYARQLAVRFQFPFYAVKMRAQQLGLTHDTRKPWSREEIEFLEDSAGVLSSKQIAKKLHRGVISVQSKMEELKISRRIVDGLASEDLASIFGVTHQTVTKWERSNWLFRSNGRFQEESVRQFIRAHPEQYDLRRVDQQLFKALLFPSASCFLVAKRA
jgi:DNA-binding transcriptional regulator YiaG